MMTQQEQGFLIGSGKVHRIIGERGKTPVLWRKRHKRPHGSSPSKTERR